MTTNAMTRTQRLCRLQARQGNFTTSRPTRTTSTATPQTVNPNPTNLSPFGSVLFRKKRFMAMVPQNIETTTTVSDLVRDRSTCPWVMVQDYNNTRFPRVMEKAVCLHNNGDNRCDTSFLEADRTNINVRNILALLEIKTECALVYAKMTVRLECCENGNYSTRTEFIDWPVACTCARKRIVSVTPSPNNGR